MFIDCTRNFLPDNPRQRHTARSNALKEWQIISDKLWRNVGCIGSVFTQNWPTGLVVAARPACLAIQI